MRICMGEEKDLTVMNHLRTEGNLSFNERIRECQENTGTRTRSRSMDETLKRFSYSVVIHRTQ